MKANAIVRIILFSIAILVLLSILGAGLAFNLFAIDIDSFIVSNGTSQDLPVVTDDTVTTGAVKADQIKNIEIEWVAGSIQIKQEGNADEIKISETATDNDKYRMVYKLDGNTLEIQYCKDSISFPSFGVNVNISKDLVIVVPEGWTCGSLEIETASAEIDVSGLTIDKVEFDGASGGFRFQNCAVGMLDVDTASGDIVFTGSLNTLDFDGASGDLTLELTNTPSSIDMDTASGDLTVTLPEDCGFTASIDGMSHRFNTDFATTTVNGNHVHGDGSCRITVDAMSGDLTIRKAE